MKKRFVLVLCTVLAMCCLLTGCKKEVAVDFGGLQHITADGADVTMTTEDYTATLIADTYYVLPETVTVSVNEEVLTEGYTYDPSTGVLTISGKSVTGTIRVEAVAEESIVGAWSGIFDLTDAVNESAAREGADDILWYENFVIQMNLVFNEDGTYAMYLDEDATEELMDSLMAQTEVLMVAYIEDMLEAQGLNISVEEFLEVAGMSIDQLLQEAFGDDSAAVMASNFERSGRYIVEDGKLYMSETEDTTPDMQYYDIYTVENGCLTLEVGKLAGEDDELVTLLSELYPMVFERVTE